MNMQGHRKAGVSSGSKAALEDIFILEGAWLRQ